LHSPTDRPAELRAFVAYHDAIMEKDSGLTKAEMEMIIVATSNDNGCQYCVVAHGAVLRIRAKNPLIADQHDFESLTSHGFNNEDIWDIAGITKFFGLSNRMANFTGMRRNDEFYVMAK
jgi:AhpD family alkylhydroperoxidase